MSPRRFIRVASAVALVCAAVSLQRAATSRWAATSTPDGAVLYLTPSGLTTTTAGVVRDCRWWPSYGDATLCGPAPGAEDGAFRRVRWAYPLLLVALWGAIGSLFLTVLRVPRIPSARIAATLATSACAFGAVFVMFHDAPAGLRALQGLQLSYSLAGAWLGWVGAALPLVSAGLQLADR